MYYHNVENLQPMEGSLNAAKGKKLVSKREGRLETFLDPGVSKVNKTQLDMEGTLTRYYLTMMHRIQAIGYRSKGNERVKIV